MKRLQQNSYTQYYTDKDNKEKVNAFNNNRKMFKLKYVGSQHSDGSNTSFLGINLDEPQQMVRKACQRAIDENIASLQKNFDQFKVNTPLISVSPLKAYIGLKEGVTEKSRFEVLEAELSKEGKMTYKRVGVIQPKENLIWDNRYMASEERGAGAKFDGPGIASGTAAFPPCAFADGEEGENLGETEKTARGNGRISMGHEKTS